jgi:hypothetical protein
MDNEEVIFQRTNVDERLIDGTLPKGGCCSVDYVPGNSEHREDENVLEEKDNRKRMKEAALHWTLDTHHLESGTAIGCSVHGIPVLRGWLPAGPSCQVILGTWNFYLLLHMSCPRQWPLWEACLGTTLPPRSICSPHSCQPAFGGCLRSGFLNVLSREVMPHHGKDLRDRQKVLKPDSITFCATLESLLRTSLPLPIKMKTVHLLRRVVVGMRSGTGNQHPRPTEAESVGPLLKPRLCSRLMKHMWWMYGYGKCQLSLRIWC